MKFTFDLEINQNLKDAFIEYLKRLQYEACIEEGDYFNEIINEVKTSETWSRKCRDEFKCFLMMEKVGFNLCDGKQFKFFNKEI